MLIGKQFERPMSICFSHPRRVNFQQCLHLTAHQRYFFKLFPFNIHFYFFTMPVYLGLCVGNHT